MNCYFGMDDQGYFYDNEEGRHYVSKELWWQIIEAGKSVGVDTSQAEAGKETVRLSITEKTRVEKFNAGEDKPYEIIEF